MKVVAGSFLVLLLATRAAAADSDWTYVGDANDRSEWSVDYVALLTIAFEADQFEMHGL